MLYYLLVPLAKDHIVFNVFRYLTFRSFMALISALVISLIVGPWLIRRLRRMQHGRAWPLPDGDATSVGVIGSPPLLRT